MPTRQHAGVRALSVEYISMLFPENVTNAAIEVKSRLSGQYKITHSGLSRQFLDIEIYREETGTGTGISLGQNSFITRTFK